MFLMLERRREIVEGSDGIFTNIGPWIFQYLDERSRGQHGTELENAVDDDNDGRCSAKNTG